MTKKQVPNKIYLTENEIPKTWYNIKADIKSEFEPLISPMTKKPITFEEMRQIFPKTVVEQEFTTDRYVDIDKEVLESFKMFRPSPVTRAYCLEKALGTPARIYYKYEGANPSGSHKLNSAIAQAFYNKREGIKNLTTETGAGQWGTALSMACQLFDLNCRVFMVKISAEQKPYRRSMMQLYGSTVTPSPSNLTESGRQILAKDPDTNGSLGDAIAEAVELAAQDPKTNYALGSVMNHVCLHQTIIGEEAKIQLEKFDEYPDIVIACNGGGTNFSGIAFPFLRDKLNGKHTNTRYIAVEAAACPKLTKGIYAYDYGDSIGMAPILKTYTLGHGYKPPGVHAGGLRYHGDNEIVAKLYNEGVIEASAVMQNEVFEAAMLFSRVEGLVPAPESSHAICQAIREAKKCKETGEEKVILFNLSGHGYFDMTAYENYMGGKIHDDIANIDIEIKRAQEEIKDLI